MKNKLDNDSLNENDIRQLIIKKRIAARQQRISAFHKTKRLQDTSHITHPNDNHYPNEEVLGTKVPSNQSYIKKFADKVLLVVEISLVSVILVGFYLGINAIKALNQEYTSSLALPTLTATPIIRPIVIPSGHKPPTDLGGARFNEDEIPEHLRASVQNYYSNLEIPPPIPETAIRIKIPVIEIDAPIIQGDGWEQLKLGVGQHIGTGLPGQPGNVVLSAHNDIYGELFRHLDKLIPGDTITIYSNTSAYTYEIQNTLIVEPSDVWVMDPTSNSTATLISCYPYLVDTKRIIVRAELLN